MGVYIKGMKMPKDHLACPFRGAITEMCAISEKWCNGFNEDCLLVEVKAPHGRVVDAEELPSFCAIDGLENTRCVLWREIDDAPTIIEAEGKDDGNT